MGLMKELNALNDIYQNMYTEDENKGYVVTRADKKGNTPAWQGYKAGKKKKDGKPMYRAADHLKDDVEIEISPEVEKLIESGLFSDAEIAKITDIQEADIADIIARLEKKRISKGGNPDDSPLPAMKKYHADKKKKKVKEDYWNEFDKSIEENRQVAMNPEKHKDPDESDKPYHKRSKAARMRDPERGINSPAFKKFMADRGM
mgnify:CR=1 FL=1